MGVATELGLGLIRLGLMLVAQRGAHVVVVHVLLYLVELPAVLLARGVALGKHSGEHGDESTVEASAEHERDQEDVELAEGARLDEPPRDCKDLRDGRYGCRCISSREANARTLAGGHVLDCLY